MDTTQKTETLTDRFGRMITYLRLSVTERCNLSCVYCRREEQNGGVEEGVLSYEEMARIVQCAASTGITKIRITGGEPLVRKDLDACIAMLRAIPAIEEVTLTTNGILLPRYAKALRRAGLDRVNISLDSLHSAIYRELNGGELGRALAGVDSARELFGSTRVNMVVLKGINDTELKDMVAFGASQNVTVRFLELMPTVKYDHSEWFMSAEEMLEILKKIYTLIPLETSQSGTTARRFRVEETGQEIGIISPVSMHFCDECSRMRLTCQGILIPCLHGKERIGLAEILREGGSDEEITNSFRLAVKMKQEQHTLADHSSFCDMQKIGG
jgi:cyclic pyranopterin phosphate synthase